MRRVDRALVIVVALLAFFGVMILYSAGQTDLPVTGHGLHQVRWLWIQQGIWLLVGTACATLVFRVSFRILEWATPWLYGLSLLALGATLILGKGHGDAASSKSWLFGVQPVEISKLATVLMLARWFSARREPPLTLRALLTPVLLAGVPALLVLKQPDLGSAIVFGAILVGVMFWAAVPVPNLILLISPLVSLLLAWSTGLWSAWMVLLFVLLLIWRPFFVEGLTVYLTNSFIGVLGPVLWRHMHDYQQMRILAFLDPERYRANGAYQAIESHIAIGSGGWFGTGFTMGPQKRSGYIPARETDFVFAVVGEELGLIGVLAALLLFLALLFVLIRIARNASDPFASLAVFGVATIIFTHVFENIGMTISVMPITGIPLPFFSYGGSFLVALAIGLGLAFRAAREGRAAGYLDAAQ